MDLKPLKQINLLYNMQVRKATQFWVRQNKQLILYHLPLPLHFLNCVCIVHDLSFREESTSKLPSLLCQPQE